MTVSNDTTVGDFVAAFEAKDPSALAPFLHPDIVFPQLRRPGGRGAAATPGDVGRTDTCHHAKPQLRTRACLVSLTKEGVVPQTSGGRLLARFLQVRLHGQRARARWLHHGEHAEKFQAQNVSERLPGCCPHSLAGPRDGRHRDSVSACRQSGARLRRASVRDAPARAT